MHNRRALRISLPILAAAFLAPLAMTGCSSTSASAFRNNPTPDVESLSRTREGVLNSLTYTTETNFRLLNKDMGRFWLSNRPSRLTVGPKPY